MAALYPNVHQGGQTKTKQEYQKKTQSLWKSIYSQMICAVTMITNLSVSYSLTS